MRKLTLFLLAIRQREADITKERVEKILASGANVILTTGGIDDLNTKYFVERGAMGVRRVLKKDMKRIAKACGGEFSSLKLLLELFPSHYRIISIKLGRRRSFRG